ncbi:hypothetical protein RFI_20981 [Reticulomyxa filosa]|uniref:Bromo domain-containing protein n=1 Tax=Reticulomyxa filosa TaxID=46433 RepID=X6MRW9_RETFI|nr:hypothetical protein RFI_20981 [Reticulomyxa filosa]|eukprot:ETO16371.1 hypothetical protein RFI_20981 [Reticulomyxa filosa]
MTAAIRLSTGVPSLWEPLEWYNLYSVGLCLFFAILFVIVIIIFIVVKKKGRRVDVFPSPRPGTAPGRAITAKKKGFRALGSARGDVMIDFCKFLEQLLEPGKKLDEKRAFSIDPLALEGYDKVVSNPMCLDWIEENIKFTLEFNSKMASVPRDKIERGGKRPPKKLYKSVKDFLDDVRKIWQNSIIFNGHDSNWTRLAEQIVTAIENNLVRRDDEVSHFDAKVKAHFLRTELRPILQTIMAHLLESTTLIPLKDDEKLLVSTFLYFLLQIYNFYYTKIAKRVDETMYNSYEQFVGDLKLLQSQCAKDEYHNLKKFGEKVLAQFYNELASKVWLFLLFLSSFDE